MVPTNTEVFLQVQFITMREKQILARTIEMQKAFWRFLETLLLNYL